MRKPDTFSGFVVTLATFVCLTALGTPSGARACSMSMPVWHTLLFSGGELLSLADPEGRVVSLSGTAASTLSTERFPHMASAFTSNGRTLVVARAEYANEIRSVACQATYVHIERFDLRSGTRTLVRRLRASDAYRVEFSPNDEYFLVEAADYAEGEPVLHLFETASGDRVRVTRDIGASFLDDETLLVRGLDLSYRVVRLEDGRRLANLPAAPEGERRRFLPGQSSGTRFHMVATSDERSTLMTVTRSGWRIRTQRARWRFRGDALETSSDGMRLVVRSPRQRLVRILDAATGRQELRVGGAFQYTQARLSEDGGRLGLVSVERYSMEDATSDPTAFQATRVEVFDLRTATTEQRAAAAWGSGPSSTLRRRE